MSFQMVLLPAGVLVAALPRFGTMSFQMVLLPNPSPKLRRYVLELCHSRWFYCQKNLHVRFLFVLL